MTESNMSRREWFRLRKPHQNRMLDDANSTDDGKTPNADPTSGLRPIESPPNYSGFDLDTLPPMREATLTPDEVKDLFSDIEQFATDIQLMQRSAQTVHASVQRVNDRDKLIAAREALLGGSIVRVQIRYRWQGSLWIDTLKKVEGGFHVVRIRHHSG